jgi:hypothetical protein
VSDVRSRPIPPEGAAAAPGWDAGVDAAGVDAVPESAGGGAEVDVSPVESESASSSAAGAAVGFLPRGGLREVFFFFFLGCEISSPSKL